MPSFAIATFYNALTLITLAVINLHFNSGSGPPVFLSPLAPLDVCRCEALETRALEVRLNGAISSLP